MKLRALALPVSVAIAAALTSCAGGSGGPKFAYTAPPTVTTSSTPPVTGVLDTLACVDWKLEDPVQQKDQTRVAYLRVRSVSGAKGNPTDAQVEALYQAVFSACGDGNPTPVGRILLAAINLNPDDYLD